VVATQGAHAQSGPASKPQRDDARETESVASNDRDKVSSTVWPQSVIIMAAGGRT